MNTAQLRNCQGRHFCPSFFPKNPGGFPVPKTNISHKILEIFLKTSSKFHKIFLHLSAIHINLLPYKYTCRYPPTPPCVEGEARGKVNGLFSFFCIYPPTSLLVRRERRDVRRERREGRPIVSLVCFCRLIFTFLYIFFSL